MADAPADQRERVPVFIPIPKTAWTTLNTVLSMNEPGQRTRSLASVFKGSGGLDRALVTRLRKGRELLAKAAHHAKPTAPRDG